LTGDCSRRQWPGGGTGLPSARPAPHAPLHLKPIPALRPAEAAPIGCGLVAVQAQAGSPQWRGASPGGSDGGIAGHLFQFFGAVELISLLIRHQ
jgi:hypothetical protein